MIPHTRTFIRGRHRAAHISPGHSSTESSPQRSPQLEDLGGMGYPALELPQIDTAVYGQPGKEEGWSSPTEYHPAASHQGQECRTNFNPLAQSTSTTASTSTSTSASSQPSQARRNSQLPFSPINTFGLPFSYNDLPDPSSFGEPTLSFMTTSTGAESSTLSTARNSEIDEVGGLGPRVVRSRGRESAGGTNSEVGSPGAPFGESLAEGLIAKRAAGLATGTGMQALDARVHVRPMGLPVDRRAPEVTDQQGGMGGAHPQRDDDSAVGMVASPGEVESYAVYDRDDSEEPYGRNDNGEEAGNLAQAYQGSLHTRAGSGSSLVQAQRTSYISSGSRRIVTRQEDLSGDDNHRRGSGASEGHFEPSEGKYDYEGIERLPSQPSQNPSYSTTTSSDAFEEDLPPSPPALDRPQPHRAMASSRTVASLRAHGPRSRAGTVSTLASTRSGSEDGYGVPLEPGVGYYNRPSPLSRRNSGVSSGNLVNLNSDGESMQGRSPRLPGFPRMPFYHNSAFEFDSPDSTLHSEAEDDDRPPRAVDLADDGRSKVVDAERLAMWGGVKSLTGRLLNELRSVYDGGVLEECSDATHVNLSSIGDSDGLHALLDVLLPLVSSSLVVLDISANTLDRLPPSLARCHGIEELNVSGNPLMSMPTWVGGMRNLRVLAVDSCGLKALPVDLMHAQGLHTICARHNRLISLPSWLSQMSRLDTLLVDGNPFAGQWMQLIAAILAKPAGVASPSRAQTTSLEEIPSPITGLSSAHALSPHLNPLMGLLSVDTSEASLATPAAVGATTLSPPVGSSLNWSRGISPAPSATSSNANRTIKRMRSAGALLGMGSMPGTAASGSLSTAPQSTAQASVRPSRTDRTSLMPIESEDSVSQLLGPGSRQSSFGETTQAKPGKWGFLRKMSMNKMRSGTSTPISRPPLPSHSNSDPLRVARTGPLRPGPLKVAGYSTMTVPTTNTLQDSPETSEFGVMLEGWTSPLNGPGLPSTSPWERRRSYLLVDQPPKLNIAIPSISPLIPSANIQPVTYPSPPRGDQHMDTSRSPPTAPAGTETRSDPAISARHLPSATNRTVAYDVGLKSIMSYLGDLYDLSLPVPVFHGGAEVVHTDHSANTSEATSELRSGSPSPYAPQGRFPSTSSAALRSRIPPSDKPLDEQSERVSRSDMGSQASLSGLAGRISVPAMPILPDPPGKRYKDESSVRTEVIRHILATERSYVAGLRDLLAIYVKPASVKLNSKTTETVIPANEVKIVFGGIEGIYRFHCDSFLPSLESVAKNLLLRGDDPSGDLSKGVARSVGDIFKRYHPFMRQYSAYINNFDFALARLGSWAATSTSGSISSATTGSGSVNGIASIAGVAGLGLPTTAAGVAEGGSSTLSIAQKKRVKSFLKDCRKHPKHTQLNLESYLLLPVQRIPRYRMLLDDLTRCTAPISDVSHDPIEIALQEMEALASMMNEEKRDSESRRRLVQWQTRIRGKFATPLVRAHRRLLLDGQLVATRTVRRTANFVEVARNVIDSGAATPQPNGITSTLAEDDPDSDDDGDDSREEKEHTITSVNPTMRSSPPRKTRPNLSAILTSRSGSPVNHIVSPTASPPSSETTIVQIEALEPEVRNMRLSVILTSDLIVLCRDAGAAPSNGPSPNDAATAMTDSSASGTGTGLNGTKHSTGIVDLVAVLKLQTKRRPASVVQGNVIRLVDNRCIWYLSAKSPAEAGHWVRTINDEFEPVR